MEVGSYRFSDVEYIEINKPFMGELYASALYCLKDKYILEVLAPKSLIASYHDYDESNKTIGEGWAENLKEQVDEEWPLENANYYIEVNGIKIGENEGRATAYRYEPEVDNENEVEEEKVSKGISRETLLDSSTTEEVLKGIEKDVAKFMPSVAGEVNSIFEDEEFKEAMISLISSLPSINLENEKGEEECLNYYEERDRKERSFFNKFRSNVSIPEYLKNESIVIADLIFRSKDVISANNTIKDLKFIIKEYRRNYLTRIKLQLPLGEYEKPVQIFSEQQRNFTDKVIVEGVVECKEEEEFIIKHTYNNMPKGKKGIYVVYEIMDNVSICPIFYTTELLNGYSLSEHVFCEPVLLKEKGLKGFNKYMAFLGYVDELTTIVDFELFQVMVTFDAKGAGLWGKGTVCLV